MRTKRESGWQHFLLPVAGFALFLAACTSEGPKPTTPLGEVPLRAADLPFNDQGACLAADVAAAPEGFTGPSLASGHCTSQDIKIAAADVLEYSYDGTTFFPFDPNTPVTCEENTPLTLRLNAHVKETATSERTDVGIWIATDGGNARTGTCNHYNLAPAPAFQSPPIENANHVWNIDNDQCGDMNMGGEAIVPLGEIITVCQAASPTSSLVHIGSCLGWTQPGGDQVCPTQAGPIGFREGTIPGTSSKCNCGGFDVPILVNKSAKLEVVKACTPSTDNGTFDLLIDNSNQFADNVGCGGTTGSKTVSAGTNASPGAVHSHGEGDFTTANYTSSFACVNRVGGASRGSGTSLGPNNITLQPNDDVVCTYTNSRKPQLKLVKLLDPTDDGGKFDFTIGATSFTNGGTGYGHNGTTGFQTMAPGSVTFSESGHTGTTIGEYSTTLECRNGAQVVASNPNATNTAGSVTLNNGDVVTCTFTNKHAPNLRLVKTPNAGTALAGGTASFTIEVFNDAGGGPALGVVIKDTLPADVGDWVENPDKALCTIVPLVAGADDRLLTCNVGTLAANTSFSVTVQATIPANFTVKPPSPAGDPIEIDGNLLDDPAGGAKDWNTADISCVAPISGCAIDLPTGAGDNSLGNGTKEDTPVPSVVDGSIPNNKSDLLRFYLAKQRITTFDHLYLAWERVQEPSGTTNMDFELNQVATPSANGVTPVRTAGDVLIKYDLAQGGVNAILGFHRWVTTGTASQVCEATNKLPCWGKVQALTNDVAGVINEVIVSDPIAPNAPRNLSVRTFGEARINLQASGIFQAGVCLRFGAAYLKSRSSDSFTAAIKDFIAPIPINLTNCEPRPLLNTAWASATNFTPTSGPDAGELGGWISDNGAIQVSDATRATGSTFKWTLPVQVALVQATSGEAVDGLVGGGEDLAIERRGLVSEARQRVGTPWPQRLVTADHVVADARVLGAFLPRTRLLA